ncbi:hypothetical protein F5Y16DRAFT_414201 [Xylariaceae sp. FL0255]|nr:hypothetical protein F5Y16DRAFT_414201 [Xylariaceae sp. FL0255]
MASSSFSTTSIGGKICTAVPRVNNVVTSTAAASTAPQPTTSAAAAAPEISISPSSSAVGSAIGTALTNSLQSTQISSPQTKSQDSFTSTQTDNSAITPAPSIEPLGTSTQAGSAAGGSFSTSTIDNSSPESSSAGGALTDGAQSVTGNAVSTQTTVAVAGGVIGGIAVISLIGFLVWFWRKRMMKKRRSTMLTPLSTDADNQGGEKGPYIISRHSLGPTTIPEKLKAVVGYSYQRIRGRVNNLVTRSPKPSVDLNRGNSQFGFPEIPASRSSSRATVSKHGMETAKERFVDWWGRLTEDGNFNWKLLRGEPKTAQSNGSLASLSNTRVIRRGSQESFLGPSDPGTGNNPQRSRSLENGNFLGSLGINFDAENPFSDVNTLHESAKVMPLTVSKPNSPFLDADATPSSARSANGVAGPTTYVQNIRRSRGYSVNGTGARPSSGTTTRMNSTYRESGMTVESVGTRRTRFRSDPFDLDRPELLAQSPNSSTAGVGGSFVGSLPDMPAIAHQRRESFTSKYSSGVSMDGWSDPGPDVGPAAERWTPSPDSTRGRKLSDPTRGRRQSQSSVGKAM